jgi:hypothetical protein
MQKLFSLTLFILLFSACSKDRDFPSSTFQNAGLPIIGTRTLIHYWNFNNSSDLVTPTKTIGGGTWDYSTANGGYFDSVSDSTTLNARNGDIAGTALRLRNPAGSFILSLPTNGYQNILFSYAVKSTSNGAQLNVVSYSIDGINFTTDGLQPNINNVSSAGWNVYSYNLSNIKKVNNNASFKIKIDFAVGNNNASGNDRFDNITVDADVSPTVLMHYWNFNSTDTSKTTTPTSSLITGAGLSFDFATTAGITGYYDTVTSTATQNARNGDVAGLSLRVRNPVNAMIINAPTTGYQNITIAYAIDRTAKGAATNNVSYSADGGVTFINTGISAPTYTPSLDPAYTLMRFDLSAIPVLNNNPNVQFKIVFSNAPAPGTSGNNRFDNLTIDGIKQ